MSIIEALQNTIISHFNNRRFSEAEQQLLVLRDSFGQSPSVFIRSCKYCQTKQNSGKQKTIVF